MSDLFAWALCRDGEIIEIYRTEIGAKRGKTRWSASDHRRKWDIRRLRCLFDELETADAKR